jgi:hypothetical protein
MSKGKNFEREISKKLSLWLTNGEDKDCIWYTKSSGGRATRRRKANEHNKRHDFGDLGPDDPKTNYFFDVFGFELKTGYSKGKKKWDMLDIIDSQQKLPIFYSFWSQCQLDCEESKREPIVIFRRERMEPCIAMHSDILDTFVPEKPFDCLTLNMSNKNKPISICNMYYFFNSTWCMVNPLFIKRKIIPTILKRKYRKEYK